MLKAKMLKDSVRLLEPQENSNFHYFDRYKTLVTEFCGYLNHVEGIQTKAFSSLEEERDVQERFNNFPLSLQIEKFENFLNYYRHCFELSTRGISLRDKGESLECFTYLYGLKIPSKDEIFSLLEKSTYVEIYDLNLTQRYRSPDWLETTSYSLATIETVDWRDLFFRSEHILARQMEVVTAIYSGQVTLPVYRPVEVHTVKELKSKTPLCAEIESLIYSPIYDRNDNFAGGLHVLKVNNLRSISFSLHHGSTSREDLPL